MAGALFKEARVLPALSDEVLEELGRKVGARIALPAIIGTMNQIGEEEITEFMERLPDVAVRCDGCYQNRSSMLPLLLEETPDNLSGL